MNNFNKAPSTPRALIVPGIFLLLLLLTAVALYLGVRQWENSQSGVAQYYFREVVTRAAATTRSNLMTTLHPVQDAAAKFSKQWPLEAAEIRALLDKHPMLGRFKEVGVALPGGQTIGNPGAAYLLKRGKDMFSEQATPHGSISETLVDSDDGLPVNVLTVPVIYQEKVVAVVFASLDSTRLSPLIEAPLFEKAGGYFIMDQKGTGISLGFGHSLNKNSLFDGLNKTTDVQPPTSVLRVQLEKGSAGSASFTHRGSPYYVAFAPLGFNNWFAVGFIPAQTGFAAMTKATKWLKTGLAGTGVLALLMLGYILWLIYRMRQEHRRHCFRMQTVADCFPGAMLRCRDDATWTLLEYNQGFLDLLGFTTTEISERFHNRLLSLIYGPDRAAILDVAQSARNDVGNGDRAPLEYRLQNRDGSLVWVTEYSHLVHEGTDTHWCKVLLDTTARRNALERRLVEEKRYRILFEMSEAILYEYDMRSGVLATTRQFFDKFGYPLPGTLNSLHPIGMEVFHPEDVETLTMLHQSLLEGETSAEALVRILCYDGQWLWCHMQQTALRDSNQRCIKALGRITDVDAETRVITQLREEMQRDAFTGLYNKVATTALVDEALAKLEEAARAEPESGPAGARTAALCIIDVDNFKCVNDRLGHDKGDEVLKSLAESLSRIFSPDDIVGRVGGDEFIAFVQHAGDIQSLSRTMEQVLYALHRTIPCSDGSVFQLSASVGVSLYPQHGTSFAVLYPRADKALYSSKKGKNIYTFYNPSMDDALPAAE